VSARNTLVSLILLTRGRHWI